MDEARKTILACLGAERAENAGEGAKENGVLRTAAYQHAGWRVQSLSFSRTGIVEIGECGRVTVRGTVVSRERRMNHAFISQSGAIGRLPPGRDPIEVIEVIGDTNGKESIKALKASRKRCGCRLNGLSCTVSQCIQVYRQVRRTTGAETPFMRRVR